MNAGVEANLICDGMQAVKFEDDGVSSSHIQNVTFGIVDYKFFFRNDLRTITRPKGSLLPMFFIPSA